jgi:hypothetical protein
MLFGVAWLAYAPFAEERDIQTRFAELCKDAGVMIVRKVEVEGFYNDVNTTALGPRTPQSNIEFKKQGFKYYEFRLSASGRVADNPESKVVHVELQGGEWKAILLKEPRARYHYKQLRLNEKVGPKIWATEYVVIDSQTGEVVGRDLTMSRLPNKVDLWWTSMFGDPTSYCPPFESRQGKGSVPHDVFIPLRNR